VATAVLGAFAIIIALNPLDSVFWLAVFAWAGLATCFGPPMILSIFWKGVTKIGAITGMLVGPVVTVVWYFWPPVDIYEGGPAFIAARSEEHTSNSSHVSISYAVFCLKTKI